MYQANKMNVIDIDRFAGEAKEPPRLGWCSYCGGGIYRGDNYFMHEGNTVCGDCSKRYAYSVFERDAVLKTAEVKIQNY